MKILILAGGFGTRLSEETHNLPKPMISIGEKPILWHIMKIYASYGFTDFIILGGYKCYAIKEYFANYFMHQSDVVFDLKSNTMKILNSATEPWKVTIIDTGLNTMTGGRIARAQDFLDDEPFMLTYGDGLADVNILELLATHRKNGKAVTVTAVQPDGRFGALALDDNDTIVDFIEKPRGDGSWINGGFFVCDKKVFNFITNGDQTIWEREPLEGMARFGEVGAYKHLGFWKPMDTLRDKIQLEELWVKGNAPWKSWK